MFPATIGRSLTVTSKLRDVKPLDRHTLVLYDAPVPKHTWLDSALARTKKLLEVGSEAADVLVHLQNGLTPVGVAAVALRAVNSVRESRALTPEEYFADWRQLEIGVFRSQALEALRLEATLKTVGEVFDDYPAVVTSTDDGFVYGWGLTGAVKDPKAAVYQCWIPKDADPDAALRRLGRALWESIGSSRATVTMIGGEPRIVAEHEKEVFESKKATEFYTRARSFLDKGYHRSIFVIGDPGVGKSCMLRCIVQMHGGFSLRLRLRKKMGLRPEDLTPLAKLLRPDTLEMDDFDRYVINVGQYSASNTTDESSAMLEPLEDINNLVPLFLVSANFSEEITEALLRPERFDELVVLDMLEPEIYRQMLPDVPKKIVDELIRLETPVVYVKELAKRVDVLGYEAAKDEVVSLVKRAERIVQINKQKTKRRRDSLVGKTPAKRAEILGRRADQIDRRIEADLKRHEKEREAAEKLRKRAEEERKKVK